MVAAEPPLQRLRLCCRGVVQGVGFRPTVHRLASGLGLVGVIENHQGEVQLDLWGARPALEALLAQLPASLPPQARLEPWQPQWLPAGGDVPKTLQIGVAAATSVAATLVAPALVSDRAPCALCLAELRDPANRRYRYPFVSCCTCGPRYSIATAEPFCRSNTSLAAFVPCNACQREFDDPADRRFHAETISCPRCGPRLQWCDLGADLTAPPQSCTGFEPIEQALTLLRCGGIVALQGVGGFQLLVDATNAPAVRRLRRRKGRPDKPLALLVAELVSLEPWLRISAAERAALHAPEAPIVLLQRRERRSAWLPQVLAPGSNDLGVMLPASPLHALLAEGFGQPLVATSGNRSGEPLCTTAAEAQAALAAPEAPIADGLLCHELAVVHRLDDSLLQCIDGRPQLLRRGRGYAPAPLRLPRWQPAPAPLLAVGGDLKSAPAIAVADRVWVAPHGGDLLAARCQHHWQQVLAGVLERYGDALQTITCDHHPSYSSVQWTHQLCDRHLQLAPWPVQHHLAHGLAVLAEHGLLPPARMVALDGLGYGEGPVPLWGGEGLELEAALHQPAVCQRTVSLRPLPLLGGALAAREPRRVALGLLVSLGSGALHHPGAAASLGAFAGDQLPLLRQALDAGLQCPLCSSVGRLLDGVASLLGLVQQLSYEGQGGLLLQGAAEAAFAGGDDSPANAYSLPLVQAAAGSGVRHWWDWQPLLLALLDDRAAGVPPGLCALRVHRALIAAIVGWASGSDAPATVILCGGCFQNRLLLEGCITALRRAGHKPYWAEQLPPGDGGLALGQLQAARLGLQRCIASDAATD